MSIPTPLLESLDEDFVHDHGDPRLLEMVQCKKCKTIPDHCQEPMGVGDIPGEFIMLDCQTKKCSTYFGCCICLLQFNRIAKARKHKDTLKHIQALNEAKKLKENKASIRELQLHPLESQSPQLSGAQNSSIDVHVSPEASSQNTPCMAFCDVSAHFFPLHDTAMSETTHDVDGNQSAVEQSATLQDATSNLEAESESNLEGEWNEKAHNDYKERSRPLSPKMEWLAQLLDNTPKATAAEVSQSLSCSRNMQRFWRAEHAAPGGGLMYLIGRAFHRDCHLTADLLPDYSEARWHMQCFMQYIGMTDKQRQWHAEITMQITSSSVGNSLIKKTCIPNQQQLKRFYKADSQHSIWNALPIPQIHNVQGIAYVCPLDIVRFAFANGLDFDNIPVTPTTPDVDTKAKQHHVGDSNQIKDWIKAIRNARAPDGSYHLCVCWLSDFRDACGTNRNKNNRKSVMTWTLSVSPSKDSINSCNNTFPMAIGQKKNQGWLEVEQRVRRDTAELADPTKPHHFYHSKLRKMVPVFLARIASCYDKPERADITGTIGYQSNNHRSFGRLIQLHTPIVSAKRVTQFLSQKEPHSALQWGWSDNMLAPTKTDQNVNGAVMPSCFKCRAKGLHALFGSLPQKNGGFRRAKGEVACGHCDSCANWAIDESTFDKLKFPAPAHYPKVHDPSCPVEPPAGRCTTPASLVSVKCPMKGEETSYLAPVEIHFDNLVKATKYAFFHLITPDSTCRWKKQDFSAYMKANGLPDKIIEEAYKVATGVVKDRRQSLVDFTDPEGIDQLRFPAAWIDSNQKMGHYIETVMHQLFLGIAKSNFELCSNWNKQKKRDTAFKRNAQELILELKKFGLNWLSLYQFTADPNKAGSSHTTGAWVGENWIGWTRLTKVLYLFTGTVKKPSDNLTGHGDIFRLVVSFTAIAARALTHAGVDDDDIREFDLLIKEFLSCVKELDVQSRNSNGTGQKAHQGTNNDAQANRTNKANVSSKRAAKPNAPSKRAAKRKRGDIDQKGTKKKSRGKKKTTAPTADVDAPCGPGDEQQGNEAFWLKSNYMSLCNLVGMLRRLGPLINFWDGGGKGEKFLQNVKPLITRGVHEYESFFVIIMEKLYKHRLFDVFQEMYSLFSPCEELADIRPRFYIGPDGEIISNCAEESDFLEADDDEADDDNNCVDYSEVEDRNMNKAKAFYTYRNEEQLDQALAENRPISGILVRDSHSGITNKLDFYAVHRQKMGFGWSKIVFDDDAGESRCGLWYAPLSKEVAINAAPETFKMIQELAKMSTVAIPMSYGIGCENKPESSKYCVITNWWKERQHSGRYKIPGLDASLYVHDDDYGTLLESLDNDNVL